MSEMREPTFLILSALADGPKHGYAIIVDAEGQSEGRVRLQAGTLYAALDRLSAEGLVHTTGEEVVGGRRRRYVGLTDDGVAALQGEAQRRAAAARRTLDRLRAATPAVAR
ncbi:MAG TPA: PadR family transcriptional regulator [Pseudolysinimonas sp.]|nr:PadR family transcriptional regulator [Pseudolysinimonas sp.]